MVKNISLLCSLCESSRWCHYDTVQDQVYISEIEFRPKKASKLPLILDNFWNNLTLKEAGRQTVKSSVAYTSDTLKIKHTKQFERNPF